MRLNDWHNETSWQGRAAFLGRLALLLAFAALPVHGPLVPLPLALGIVLLLPQALAFGHLRDKGLLLLPVAFYLLHVVGMAYSTDIAFGLFDLEVKLSLLLVPLVAAGLVHSGGKDFLRTAMIAFSIGLLIAMALSVRSALSCYGAIGGLECFTQSNLSARIHPSYMAWFACWTLFFWGKLLADGGLVPGRWRMIVACFLVLLLGYIVMLTSKSGLVGLVVVMLFLVYHAMRTLDRRTGVALVVLLIVVMAIPLAFLGPVLSGRIHETVGAVQRMLDDDPSLVTVETSTNERLTAWGCSVDCLTASPWGTGTGDIKHALMACYREKGATAAIQHRLNSHSQILQSGVALGWPGLLLVCAMMMVPLLIGIRRNDPFLSIFALLFIVNGAIESVLEVQAGVVFFILFYIVLVRRSSSVPQEKSRQP
ncbi:MAG: O-antigen ligase family protein [Flavobacteriales bacterium]|jgi:hypothetical protein|nr:O-antigen ligase family protein [Flavobacteriales bacterium]